MILRFLLGLAGALFVTGAFWFGGYGFERGEVGASWFMLTGLGFAFGFLLPMEVRK